MKRAIVIILVSMFCILFLSACSFNFAGMNFGGEFDDQRDGGNSNISENRLYMAIMNQNLELAKEAIEEMENIDPAWLLLCMQNDAQNIFKYLLEKGADANYCDKNTDTSLLMYACGAKKESVNLENVKNIFYVDKLIEYGADINFTDNNHNSILDYAVRDSDNDEIVCSILSNNPEISKNTLKFAFLGFKNANCSIKTIRKLIEQSEDSILTDSLENYLIAVILGDSEKTIKLLSNKSDKIDADTLFFAAAYCDPEIIKTLENNGFDLSAKDSKGNTLLIIAAQNGNQNVLQYLLDKESNLNVINYDGETALSVSALYNHLNCVKLLIDYGANLVVTNDEFSSDALLNACSVGNLEIVKELNNKFKCNKGEIYQAMATALTNGKIEVIDYFISKGADIKYHTVDPLLTYACMNTSENKLNVLKEVVRLYKSCDEETQAAALNMAVVKGQTDLVKYLVDEKNFDVNRAVRYADGSKEPSCITLAILNGYYEITKILVENGADISSQDSAWENKTALEIAQESGSQHILTLIKNESIGK